jgi:hypothetical protein
MTVLAALEALALAPESGALLISELGAPLDEGADGNVAVRGA